MNEKDKRDTLFDSPEAGEKDFAFNENVVSVFDDMIHRSLPGYDAIIAMIGVLAERYAKEDTNCYDLGCSLGAVTFSILRNIEERPCHIIAIDNSEAMVNKLQETVNASELQKRVEVRQEDIRDTIISNASVVVLNFVLQFLEPKSRTPILKKIYDGMSPGSILILSEKIDFDNEKEGKFQIDMHQEFKKLHGYSDMEISQKRAALENVLIPDTEMTYMRRLEYIGFSQYYLWFQCFNFISIVAIK